ncbi:TRAP transporter large permease [Microbaculum marinum]|uniref:TRAP transporter large permease protein n=1 Tax=Microbaculum marinum TaxID=1764581 RepID=A0AAW9RGA7_9HYPH
MIAAALGFAIVIAMVFARIPIAVAMAIVGFFGFAMLVDFYPAFYLVGQVTRTTVESYELSVVPLFILMGNFVSRARISEDLYAASHAFIGHYKGGLAMSTIVACGGFSAICGSSLATAATMAKVAMPPMRKYGYADSLAAASISAGGTLGILIPPSVILVLFGLLTETDIRALFAAGLLPGLLGVACYLAAVRYVVWRHPERGPAGERVDMAARLAALRGVWPVIALFVLVIGGIYAGIFTPTESGGIGAFGAFVFALVRRALNWRTLLSVLIETAVTTSALFVVLIGALIFANFINETRMTTELARQITDANFSPMLVMLVIIGIYLVLGCVFESMSMLLLTVPVFASLIAALDFGMTPEETMIWFGIVVVVVTEISLITPPIGMNVFTLSSMLPDVSTKTIFAGVFPFWSVDIIRLAILVLVPGISLLIPSLI